MKEGKAGLKTYLVEVTAVTKAPAQENLSYFSSEKLVPGTIVRVPIRKTLVTAVVVHSRDVRHARSDIRRAGFVLKKIRKGDVLEATLAPEVLNSLIETATRYALPLSHLLSGIVPKLFWELPQIFLKPGTNKKRVVTEEVKETILLQMEREERFAQYRALVRQAFARGNSLMFVVPTALEVKRVVADLSKGIEEFTFCFTLGKKREVKQVWQKALSEKHPILFITTPAGLLLPREDLGTIVIERENSRAYRTLTRPHLHFVNLIETLARQTERLLVLGDSVLSLQTLWREKRGEFGESSLIRWRLPAAPTQLVDAKGAQNEKGRFEIFSPELKEFMTKALQEEGKIFLFGARKGLAPTTVCSDCGTILPCQNCGAGVVLHRIGEATIYICHACGGRRESTTTCGYCGSWKLTPLGIGTEEIAHRAQVLFPQVPIQILDKDYAPTDTKANLIAKNFAENGGIVVGTELAFFHLEDLAYSALVSVDALFSIPDFGINERIFYLVSRLREMTKKEALVQTRNIGKQVLAWASFGNIIDFYQNEIDERESLLYPPFSIFVKVTALNPMALQDLMIFKEKFLRWHPDILKNSLVMRIPRTSWPDPELVEKLTLLGPAFSIKVDPESIL